MMYQVAMTIPNAQIMVLKYYFPLKEIRALRKMVIPYLGQKTIKMSLDHLTVPDSKKSSQTTMVMLHNAKSNKEMLTDKEGHSEL